MTEKYQFDLIPNSRGASATQEPDDLLRALLSIVRSQDPKTREKLEDIKDTFSDDERFTEREPEEDPQTGWVE